MAVVLCYVGKHKWAYVLQTLIDELFVLFFLLQGSLINFEKRRKVSLGFLYYRG